MGLDTNIDIYTKPTPLERLLGRQFVRQINTPSDGLLTLGFLERSLADNIPVGETRTPRTTGFVVLPDDERGRAGALFLRFGPNKIGFANVVGLPKSRGLHFGGVLDQNKHIPVSEVRDFFVFAHDDSVKAVTALDARFGDIAPDQVTQIKECLALLPDLAEGIQEQLQKQKKQNLGSILKGLFYRS